MYTFPSIIQDQSFLSFSFRILQPWRGHRHRDNSSSADGGQIITWHSKCRHLHGSVSFDNTVQSRQHLPISCKYSVASIFRSLLSKSKFWEEATFYS